MWEGSHKRHWVSNRACPHSALHELRFCGLEQCWHSPGWKYTAFSLTFTLTWKIASRCVPPKIPQLCLESPLPGCDSILPKCICNNPIRLHSTEADVSIRILGEHTSTHSSPRVYVTIRSAFLPGHTLVRKDARGERSRIGQTNDFSQHKPKNDCQFKGLGVRENFRGT